MKMSKFMSSLMLPVLVLGLALFFEPTAAQAAKRITLQNATPYPIDTVLVVQTYNGWRVRGWYSVAAYSYRHVNINDAGGAAFGYYAKFRSGPNATWAGKNNEPTIAIVSSAMNHDVRQQPYGNNQRRVKVRMRQGESVKFTYNAMPQQQQYRNTGWW